MSDYLIIFVKNLIPGMVKTRLADKIGIYPALDVYNEMVHHTHDISRKLEINKSVYYSEYVEIEDIWDKGGFELKLQKGNSLGKRMSNAFDEAFDSYKKVVLIGSDCYDLTKTIIQDAFVKLSDSDVVIGPAKDGGYYLIGMKEFTPQLFENKTYGSEKVLSDIIDEIDNLKLSYHLLPVLADIDTFDDLKESEMDWRALIERNDEDQESDIDF